MPSRLGKRVGRGRRGRYTERERSRQAGRQGRAQARRRRGQQSGRRAAARISRSHCVWHLEATPPCCSLRLRWPAASAGTAKLPSASPSAPARVTPNSIKQTADTPNTHAEQQNDKESLPGSTTPTTRTTRTTLRARRSYWRTSSRPLARRVAARTETTLDYSVCAARAEAGLGVASLQGPLSHPGPAPRHPPQAKHTSHFNPPLLSFSAPATCARNNATERKGSRFSFRDALIRRLFGWKPPPPPPALQQHSLV